VASSNASNWPACLTTVVLVVLAAFSVDKMFCAAAL
jgi:hypothetical protein